MRLLLSWFLLLVVFINASCALQPEENRNGKIWPTKIHRHQLYAAKLDESFVIDVVLPAGYSETEEQYPIIYLLDDEITFWRVVPDIVVLQRLGELPPAIIVSVSYQNREMSGTLRRRDLTPTTFERYYQLQNHPRDVGLGQANEFLQFINSSIKPLVHKRYRSKESDNTLVGYSLSGLFSLYVLFHHTESFDRYVVGSPSLWWDSGITFQYEEEYARTNLSLPVHLYLSVGTLESTESKMQANVRQLITQLQSRSYTHLTLDTDIFENETHGSGLAHGLLTGLRRVFENYQGH